MTKVTPQQQRRLRIELARVYPLIGSGEHLGSRVRNGFEPAGARPYCEGDDARSINPWLSGRSPDEEPVVQLRLEEHDIDVMLIVDLSLRFTWDGLEARDFKTQIAQASAEAWMTVYPQQADRCGLLVLGETIKTVLPGAGDFHRGRMQSVLRNAEPAQRDKLGEGLARLARVPRKELVIVLSDFLAPIQEWETPLRRLAARHEVVAVQLLDKWDMEMPNLGVIRTHNPNTGRVEKLDTGEAATRERFKTAAADEQAEREDLFRKAKVTHVRLDTNTDWLSQLIRTIERVSRRVA